MEYEKQKGGDARRAVRGEVMPHDEKARPHGIGRGECLSEDPHGNPGRF